MAAVCLGLTSTSALAAPAKTTANDPLPTQVMPITKGAAAPGSSAIPAAEPAPAAVDAQPTYSAQSGAAYSSPSVPAPVAATAPMEKLNYSDRRFVKKVAEGSQLEIAMAQLAVQRASAPAVRSFAETIVSDHTAMSGQLEQLATRKGLRAEIAEYRATNRSSNVAGTDSTVGLTGISVAGAPTGRASTTDSTEWNDPTTNRHYRRLAAKSGTDFDQAFIAAMVDDHEDDVAMFDKKAQKADDADLRSFAASNLPTLRQHLESAKQLSAASK